MVAHPSCNPSMGALRFVHRLTAVSSQAQVTMPYDIGQVSVQSVPDHLVDQMLPVNELNKK